MIFDAIDHWRVRPQKMGIRKTLVKSYDRIIDKVDLILMVSPAPRTCLSIGRTNVYWLPNGADIEFSKQPRRITVELAKTPRPIILYVGKLQKQIDVNILSGIASNCPQSSLVLVGPIVTPPYFQPLKRFSNTHFLGRKPHNDIAAFIQHADVCILPHMQPNFTMSMNPLKLCEPLAARKQVVATSINGHEEFAGILRFASTPEEFINLVDEALKPKPTIAGTNKVHFINKCAWKQRIGSILVLLTVRLGKMTA